MQRNGWIIGIMIERARMIRRLSRIDQQAAPIGREELREGFHEELSMFLGTGMPMDGEDLESHEVVYTLQYVTHKVKQQAHLRFIGPTDREIRRIKAERVEQNKMAKAARAERAEIAKDARRVGRRRPKKEAENPVNAANVPEPRSRGNRL